MADVGVLVPDLQGCVTSPPVIGKVTVHAKVAPGSTDFASEGQSTALIFS